MFDLFELLRRGRCATGTESSLGSGSASQTRVAHWCALRQLTPIACLIITDINGNVHGGLSAFVVDPGSAVDPVHSRDRDELRADLRARAEHAERQADAYRDELAQLRAGTSHDTDTTTASRTPRRTRQAV